VFVRPLWIIFERSLWSRKVPKDRKKTDVTPIFRKGKKLGNYRPVSIIWISGKVMKQVVLEIIFRHRKSNEVTGSSQHRF